MYPFKVRNGNSLHQKRSFLKKSPTEWREVLLGNIIDYFWNHGEHDGLYIDCGAAYGIASVSMAHKYKKVLSLECEYRNYKLLKENCSYYNNIETMNIAVGDREDVVTVHSYSNSPLTSYVSDNNKVRTDRRDKPDSYYKNIPMKTIDSLVSEKVNAIKIDVEGYELNVIRGAIETLKNNDVLCIIECFDERKDILTELMSAIGYRYIETLDSCDMVFRK